MLQGAIDAMKMGSSCVRFALSMVCVSVIEDQSSLHCIEMQKYVLGFYIMSCFCIKESWPFEGYITNVTISGGFGLTFRGSWSVVACSALGTMENGLVGF